MMSRMVLGTFVKICIFLFHLTVPFAATILHRMRGMETKTETEIFPYHDSEKVKDEKKPKANVDPEDELDKLGPLFGYEDYKKEKDDKKNRRNSEAINMTEMDKKLKDNVSKAEFFYKLGMKGGGDLAWVLTYEYSKKDCFHKAVELHPENYIYWFALGGEADREASTNSKLVTLSAVSGKKKKIYYTKCICYNKALVKLLGQRQRKYQIHTDPDAESESDANAGLNNDIENPISLQIEHKLLDAHRSEECDYPTEDQIANDVKEEETGVSADRLCIGRNCFGFN